MRFPVHEASYFFMRGLWNKPLRSTRALLSFDASCLFELLYPAINWFSSWRLYVVVVPKFTLNDDGRFRFCEPKSALSFLLWCYHLKKRVKCRICRVNHDTQILPGKHCSLWIGHWIMIHDDWTLYARKFWWVRWVRFYFTRMWSKEGLDLYDPFSYNIYKKNTIDRKTRFYEHFSIFAHLAKSNNNLAIYCRKL